MDADINFELRKRLLNSKSFKRNDSRLTTPFEEKACITIRSFTQVFHLAGTPLRPRREVAFRFVSLFAKIVPDDDTQPPVIPKARDAIFSGLSAQARR